MGLGLGLGLGPNPNPMFTDNIIILLSVVQAQELVQVVVAGHQLLHLVLHQLLLGKLVLQVDVVDEHFLHKHKQGDAA